MSINNCCRMGKLVLLSCCCVEVVSSSTVVRTKYSPSFTEVFHMCNKISKFIWVPTMIAIFRYVPVKFQVLVINVVGVVWNTFLAYATNNAHSSSEKENDNGNDKVVEKRARESTMK